MAIPEGYTSGTIGFLFIDGKIRFRDWIYFLSDHLILIILAYIIWAETKTFRFSLFVFFAIQVLDLIDFIFTFNNPWYQIGWLPVSMNTLGTTLLTLAIIRDAR